jgi:hypothetical protein
MQEHQAPVLGARAPGRPADGQLGVLGAVDAHDDAPRRDLGLFHVLRLAPADRAVTGSWS